MVELARTRPDDIVRVDFRKFDGHKDEASSSQNKSILFLPVSYKLL